MKVVTLKKFPFANENSVVNIGGYAQLGNNIRFKAGKYSYSLFLGQDIRPFVAATDSSLPVALLPKSIGSFTSDLGSYSLMAWLFYRGFKQNKGVGYYIGYGILGWMGGGIAGRMLGNLFSNKYTEAGSKPSGASKADSKISATSSTSSLNDSLITTASNNISAIAKKRGNNISGNDVKTKILEASKKYNTIEKDVLAALLNIFGSEKFAKIDNLPKDQLGLAFFGLMAESFEPLSKKYSESEVEKAGKKVFKDVEQFLPMAKI
jgi:hypothetical protein